MKITIVLLTVIVLLASKGLEANYSENSVDADFDAGFRNGSISTFLSRFTCGSGSTCDGMDNAYTATRGVGCSTQCDGTFRSFARAGLSGLRFCSRRTAPAGTEFIQGCYCCFGYVLDRTTSTCILPSACSSGFGTY